MVFLIIMISKWHSVINMALISLYPCFSWDKPPEKNFNHKIDWESNPRQLGEKLPDDHSGGPLSVKQHRYLFLVVVGFGWIFKIFPNFYHSIQQTKCCKLNCVLSINEKCICIRYYTSDIHFYVFRNCFQYFEDFFFPLLITEATIA